MLVGQPPQYDSTFSGIKHAFRGPPPLPQGVIVSPPKAPVISEQNSITSGLFSGYNKTIFTSSLDRLRVLSGGIITISARSYLSLVEPTRTPQACRSWLLFEKSAMFSRDGEPSSSNMFARYTNGVEVDRDEIIRIVRGASTKTIEQLKQL